ncbi:MAG: PLP-dependent aminotransferase family protein [Mycobacterium leprae]
MYQRFFPASVRAALGYDAPGSWMPALPPGSIRFSAGYPFRESIPDADLAAATAALVADEGDLPFHYLGSPSMAQLDRLLAARSTQRGMAPQEGELLVTAGAAQAIDLAARALLGPDDLVLVEAPTYMEALEIFRNYTPHILSCPVDDQGLRVDILAQELANRQSKGLPMPKLLYTIASFQNPTGACLSLQRRRELLLLAEAYDFLVLEDDAYGQLAFGEPPVPLKALDQAGRVIHVGSLSKVVAPGLRIGWALGPQPVIEAMSLFKKDLDHSAIRAVTARYLAGVDMAARVDWLRNAYRVRCNHLLALLAGYMPEWVTWSVPQGGFFIWLNTPGVDTMAMLPRALQAGVAYIPGKHFYFQPGTGLEQLRLSFSYLPPEAMTEGVERLAAVLKAER